MRGVGRYTGKQVDRYTGRHVDRYTGRHVDRYTGRQVHRSTCLRVYVFTCLLVYLLIVSPVHAQGPLTDVKTDVAFDQNLDAQVPLDLVFRDEDGQTVKLGDYFGNRPVILTLNYFHCPNLCLFELDQLTGALTDLSFNLGDEYAVVSVSIDPRETPQLAAEAKWQYVRKYARPNRGAGWHFLTGDEAAIEALTRTVGFHYAYDAATDEYAHPTGLIILTPQGKIARYLYGVDYVSRDLRLALVEASQNQIGSAVDQILLLCYRYDAANGKYSSLVLSLARWTGAATVVVMGVFLGWLWRRDLKQKA